VAAVVVVEFKVLLELQLEAVAALVAVAVAMIQVDHMRVVAETHHLCLLLKEIMVVLELHLAQMLVVAVALVL
jgi:hypothetical protein